MNIRLGQIVLLIGLLLFIIYVFRIRKLVFDRIVFILGAVIGLVLVLFPNISTVVANGLGIGRGVDLIFYLFIVLCLFYFVSVSAELRLLRRQITELNRIFAISNAQMGKPKPIQKLPVRKKGNK